MLKYDSDISTLIHSMDENQRKNFITFIKILKDEGLDKSLNKSYNELTCDDIINNIISTNENERKQKLKEDAASKGTTTIEKSKWGVHETHCCILHGCKYNDVDCPVELALIKQKYTCESCNDYNYYDTITSKIDSKISNFEKIDKAFIISNRKLKLYRITK